MHLKIVALVLSVFGILTLLGCEDSGSLPLDMDPDLDDSELPVSYSITIDATGAITGESLAADLLEAGEGDAITLTATLGTDREVMLSGIIDSSSQPVSIVPSTLSSDGETAGFVMPAGDVTISAGFQDIQPPEGEGEINYIEDLLEIAQDLSADYTLMRDLDFTDPASYESGSVNTALTTGEGFTPIGTPASRDNPDTKFSGSFDGQGYTISHLTINRVDEYYIGLFGVTSVRARIHDLNLADPAVAGKSYVGALIGRIDNAYETSDATPVVLASCSVTGGSVAGGSDTGGIVGCISNSTERDCSISNCSFQGTVDGESDTGGIFGSSDCESLMTISSCETLAGSSVSGTGTTGGLAGTIDNLISITSSINRATVSGSTYIGGIAGAIAGNSPESTITDSLSFGNVTVNGTGGGFIGLLYNASVENCHSSGNITIPDDDTGSICGGFIGKASYQYEYSSIGGDGISCCSSTGTIAMESSSSASVGGFIGTTYMDVSDCYNSGIIDVNSYGETGGFMHNADYSVVRNCYTISSINGAHDQAVVGGMSGYLGSEGSIQNCIAFGDSIGSGTGENINANLFIGSNFGGSTSQIYVNDAMTISYTIAPFPNGLSGDSLTADAFLNQASDVYSTWDFDGTWVMEAEGPELRAKTALLDSLP